MADTKPDIQADFLPDAGESLSLMEPVLLSSECSARAELTDLCLELAQRSASLRSSLPQGLLEPLACLVRAMNCYYSNLIEGHNTHPIDIERALLGNYSKDKRKRDLQMEAKAHIAVQEWIDNGGLSGSPLSTESALEIHRRFCELLPEELLWVEGATSKDLQKVIPGAFRNKYVQVGGHVPVSPGSIPRFMHRFETAYSRLGKLEQILCTAAAHHRFLWIHPFLDGNGRVARLISYAQFLQLADTGSVWSVARGLARQVEEYKTHLMNCDQQRHGDYDGRGNLSEAALAGFTRFFLSVSIDQIKFMSSLIQPEKLRTRILIWVEEESRTDRLLTNAGRVMEALVYRGELPRGDVPALLGVGERQARRVMNALFERGAITSKSDRAPLHLAFPATLAPRWLPGLFPESPGPFPESPE